MLIIDFEKFMSDSFQNAPYFKSELILFWDELESSEKNKYLNETIFFLDSHRGKVESYKESPIEAVVKAFCYKKRLEITYNPTLKKEQYQLDELEKCNWLK